MPKLKLSLLGIGLSLISCSQEPAPAPAYKMVSTVEDVMEGIVIPASDRVFEVGAYNVTTNGVQESIPKDDEEWSLVKHSAMSLAEAGNLLKFESRAQEANWVKFSQMLTDRALVVAAKADAKDTQGVFDAAAAMYQEACTGCHAQYLTEPPPQ